MNLRQVISTTEFVGAIVLLSAWGVILDCGVMGQDTEEAKPFFRPIAERFKTEEDRGFLLKLFKVEKDVDDIETWSAARFNELAFELEARRDEVPGTEALNRAQLCAERALGALMDMDLDHGQRQKRLAEYLDMTLSLLKDSEQLFVNKKIPSGDLYQSKYLYANAKLTLLRSQLAESAIVPEGRQKD